MPKFRFTISGMMGVIVVAAIGFAGIREGTEIWAGVTFAVTALILLMALPCLVYSRGAPRAAWFGFTLFGWAYLLFIFWWPAEQLGVPPSPLRWLLDLVHDRIHAKAQYVPNPNFPVAQTLPFAMPSIPGGPLIIKPGTTYWMGDERHYRQVAHCLLALAFGAFGAFWSRQVYSFQLRRSSSASPARESSTNANANAADPDATSTGHLD
jgi:hypothetical protein